MAQRTENPGQGTERDGTRDRQVASTGRQLTPAAAATTTKITTTTTTGGDFQVKAAAAAIMQRAPAPASASTVAVPAPDTAPTAARAITMSRQSGKGRETGDRFKSVQNATRDWLKALTGADVDSAFDRRTAGQTEGQRDSHCPCLLLLLLLVIFKVIA